MCLTDRLKGHFALYTSIEYMSIAVLSVVMSSKAGHFFLSILEVIKVNLKHMMLIELYKRQVSSDIQNKVDPMHKKTV